MGFFPQLAAVHLTDSHYITDASKYVSVLLLSLRAMLQLELPHINVLSKIDLVAAYTQLRASISFFQALPFPGPAWNNHY
jgi:hypothetical protein